MIPRSLLPGAHVTALALLVAAAGVPLWALMNPGGASGDLHRAVVVCLCGGAALLLAWHRLQAPEPADEPRRGDALLALPFGLVLLAAGLQLAPLPAGVADVLAPATGRLHALEAAARGVERGARPLSIEPQATERAALLGLAYLAFALALRPVARRADLARWLAFALAGLGALATFLALFGLAGAASPAQWRGRPTAPFLNPNHLATFLVLALGPGLGALLVPREGRAQGLLPWLRSASRDVAARRGLAGLAVALSVVGLLLTGSRAGALAGAVTVALVLAPRLRAGQRLLAALIVLAVGGGVILGDPDPLRARFDEAATRLDTLGGRVENWGVAARVIAGRPLAGAGLGTFRDASVAVLTTARAGNTRPGEAHHDYLELLAGVGVPLGGAALLALAALVVLAARRAAAAPPRPRAVAEGAWAGLVGALVHACFDFALQVPGPALLALACLGLAWWAPAAEEPRAELPSRGPLRRAAPALLLGLALLLAGLPLLLQAQAEARGRAAFASAQAPGVTPDLRPELLRRAERVLAGADGSRSRADVAHLRFQALQGAGDEGRGPELERAARAAVERAPGRAEYQAALGVHLYNAGRREGGALLREGEGRLALALELGPTTPGILLVGGEWALDRLAATGDRGELLRAEALFAEALRREPGLRLRVRALLERHAARLGEDGERLRMALETAR